MGFSLWSLTKTGLLGTNALAILNENRFLAKYDLHDVSLHDRASIKGQVAGFLTAVRYLRVPLIIVNILAIVMEIFFG